MLNSYPTSTSENEKLRFAEDAFELVQSCPALNKHNFLELLGLFLGQKRVVRLVVTEETYSVIAEFCQRNGLTQGHSRNKQAPQVFAATGDMFTVSVDWDDPLGKYFVVIIGQNYNEVRVALDCENGSVPYRVFGELYEYPPCCIEAYADLVAGGEWVSAYLRRSPVEQSGSIYSNRLAALFDGSTLIPDFFPCRLNCEPASELGRRYQTLLKNIGRREYLTRIETSLSTPILVRSGSLLQLRGSKRSGKSISYDQAMVRQPAWERLLPNDDPFWRADSLLISGERLQLLSGGQIVADEPTGLVNNRLLVFE